MEDQKIVKRIQEIVYLTQQIVQSPVMTPIIGQGYKSAANLSKLSRQECVRRLGDSSKEQF